MPGGTLVIVNPRSASGATGRRWAAVEAKLCDALGPVEVEQTRGPRDAERIAREGVRAGIERIVVAGGDGTLSEVATGLLAAGLAGYASVGLLPLGTGGDFVRTAGIPRDTDRAIEVLSSGKIRTIDAGRATFRDHAGAEAVAYFVNIASFGISGLVDEMVNRSTKALGGTVSFLLGTLRALARHRSEPVTLRVDGDVVHQGPLVFATAANGRYFGGGMHVAPGAAPDDGLLDVVVVPDDASKAQLAARLPRLYRGTHIGHGAALHRGQRVEAETASGRVLVDLDGEPLGTLPTRLEVLPGALSLVVPPS